MVIESEIRKIVNVKLPQNFKDIKVINISSAGFTYRLDRLKPRASVQGVYFLRCYWTFTLMLS